MSLELLCLLGTEHNNSVHPTVTIIISGHNQTLTERDTQPFDESRDRFLDVALHCEQTSDMKMLKGLCPLRYYAQCSASFVPSSELQKMKRKVIQAPMGDVCYIKRATFENFVYYFTTLSEELLN